MAELIPVPKIQFFDANGNPLPGGKIYSYASGTLTTLATYADAAALVPNPNPVVLDAGGWATIFLGPSNYTIQVKTAAEVTVYTQDNVRNPAQLLQASLSGSGGSALMGYIQSGAGAVMRNVQTRLRERVSLKDFDGIGDGSDQTQSFIDAIARVAPGGQIEVPEGDFRFSAVLSFADKPGVTMIGRAREATLIRTDLTTHNGIGPDNYCRFAHFTLRGGGWTVGIADNTLSQGITTGDKTGVVLEDLIVENWPSFALNAGGNAIGWWIRYNVFRHSHGVLLPQGNVGMHFLHNDVYDMKYNGVDTGGCVESFIIGNRIHNCGLAGASGVTNDVSGLFMAGIGGSGILSTDGDANIVQANHIYDNHYGPGIDIRCTTDLTCDRNLILGNHCYRNTHGILVGGNAAGATNHTLVEANHCYDNQQYGIAVDGASVVQQVLYTRVSQNFTRNNGTAGIVNSAKDTQIVDNTCIDEGTPILDLLYPYTMIYGNKIASSGPPYAEAGTEFSAAHRIIAGGGLNVAGGVLWFGDATLVAQEDGAIRMASGLPGAIAWRNSGNTDDEGLILMNADVISIRGGAGDGTPTGYAGILKTGPVADLNALSWHNEGRVHFWGAQSFESAYFPVNATLPTVTGHCLFITQNSATTVITNFLGGAGGQIFYLVAGDGFTTIVHSSQIRLKGGVNVLMTNLSIMTFLNISSVGWIEL